MAQAVVPVQPELVAALVALVEQAVLELKALVLRDQRQSRSWYLAGDQRKLRAWKRMKLSKANICALT